MNRYILIPEDTIRVLPPEDGSVNLRGTCQGVPVTILMDPGVNYSIIMVTQQPYLELSDLIQI